MASPGRRRREAQIETLREMERAARELGPRASSCLLAPPGVLLAACPRGGRLTTPPPSDHESVNLSGSCNVSLLPRIVPSFRIYCGAVRSGQR